MEQKRSRPANRPSRRPDILRAATELLSVQLPDAISVADITAQAGMTPAAFYYHFAGKDELIEELVTGFATAWSAQVVDLLEGARTAEDLGEMLSRLVTWLDDHEREATMYFVTSTAATERAEEIKRQTRNDLFDVSIRVVRRIWDGGTAAETAVAGVALVVLAETTARSRLQRDESYRGLGPVRFRSIAAGLARGIVGGGAVPAP